VADYLVRHSGVGGSFERVGPIESDAWKELPGWNILFGENASAGSNLPGILRRLPSVLRGLA